VLHEEGDKLLKLAGGSSCIADSNEDVLVEHRGDNGDARDVREAPEQPGNPVFLSNPSTRYSSFLIGLVVQIFVPESVDVDDVDLLCSCFLILLG
jgi:hypothetical protein